MLVRAILQQKGADVVTASDDETVEAAARRLATRRIGALVVTAEGAAGGDVRGILSERDIVRGLAERGPAVLTAPVSSLMTTDVRTCGLDDGLEDLMATMTEHRIRHLPVLDGPALVGIVSIGDVVKHRVGELQVEARTLHDYIETGR
jgi:CBS domain-containing protein